MVRIAPVRLEFNPKTLWFDAGELTLFEDDAVVVSTARGEEFGHISAAVFEMSYEDVQNLKSPLKPVLRLATPEDVERQKKAEELAKQALPIYRQIAAENLPDMHPVAVEYLFDGDKAIFYFEAEDRVDFRELVRKLAAEFHVRVDMKQIGVRDGARMVGAIGHCGQEICCRRLGGEFNPVSIRMAKEQDLSLNPQKISGLCGRLMCCLRYEFEAYKDFHSRAPKKNATIETPDGPGKVVDMDVPRETISIKVEDEKPVKVPLKDMEPPVDGKRPSAVGDEAWEKANEPDANSLTSAFSLFGTSQLDDNVKLAEPGQIRHLERRKEDSGNKSRSRRGRRGGSSGNGARKGDEPQQTSQRKQRRRRSTTVSAEGAATVESQQNSRSSSQKQHSNKGQQRGRSNQSQQKRGDGKKNVKVGRNSSGLRSNRNDSADKAQKSGNASGNNGQRRRRRSHKTDSD